MAASHSCKIGIQVTKGEMGGSKSSLGFLVLLLIVLFSGTSSGEFGDNPAQAVVMGGGRGVVMPEES